MAATRLEEPLKRDRFAPSAREVESPEVKGELSAKLRPPQRGCGAATHLSACGSKRHPPGPWTRRPAISDHTACHGWLELR